jgi:hypothetical protein
LCGIVINIAVTLCRPKQPLDGLEVNVSRSGRNVLRKIVAKCGNMRPGDQGDIEFSIMSKECQKFVDALSVFVPGGLGYLGPFYL